MSVQMTGKQWIAFYADKEYWPKGRYHDDHIILLNGERSDIPTASPEKLAETDIVTVEYGDVMDGFAQRIDDLPKFAQSWLFHRTSEARKIVEEEDVQIRSTLADLLEVAQGYKAYIDALPEEVVNKLPAMPGIDGDWADETIDTAKRLLKS